MTAIGLRSVLLGAATGGRSMTGLAAVAWTTPTDVDAGWVRRLGSAWGRGLTALAAAGEIAADKSPRIPSRLSPPVLAERVVVAGIAAAALARREGRRVAGPVALATLAVVAASAAGTRWRGYIQRRGGSGMGAAVAEDLASVGLAVAAAT